ncbi:hypothetical protein F7725_001591 [Dissostichus mawsoni]|uniref:Ileal sodium/bile acid cotransporter n=1 Tax=Dissostichus mawsoni TaxID=36200 RepID=A0A7J5Y020_DISMA|nr:hypothetical protein F7725_001591 [Dissostichus mawsoni]
MIRLGATDYLLVLPCIVYNVRIKNCSAHGCQPLAAVCSGANCLVPLDSFNEKLSLAMSVVLTVMLAMVMFSMGCTVDASKLWGHIKRPWGIFIGFLCQFGIMPFTAFALSTAFNVLPVQAIVIIIMGCCPGGSGSNHSPLFSVSMTACSSILALGMMPLCLLIYTATWTSTGSIQIPYDSIAVVGGILYQSSWDIDPSLWIIGTIYPFIGFSMGFFFARFAGQPWHRCRTIGLETGLQNSQLCSTIVQLSFSPAELEVMFSFPLIYSIFQLLVSVISVGGYQLYKRYRKPGSDDADSESPALEAGDDESAKKNIHAVENGGFEFDDISKSEEKNRDVKNATQL